MFKRRHEWFERLGIPITVLWWEPAGTVPSVDEALERLETLRERGPTHHAFTFKERFPPPGEDVIRKGVEMVPSGSRDAEPTIPLFKSGPFGLGKRADDLLEGFGEQ